MSSYHITLEAPDSAIADLSKVVGVVEMLPTLDGKAAEEILETGNFHLSPYGIGEKDEDGNITKFELTGFSILPGGVK